MVTVTGTDWEIVRVAHMVDGDTFDVILSRPVGVIDGFQLTATSLADKPARLRVLHLDTPEEGDAGYHEATSDAKDWLYSWDPSVDGGLRVKTYGKDSFGRYLSDVYPVSEPDETFSRYMLLHANDGHGWPPYTGK